ncbi:MAG TPA: tetratricopeptide repeat protein [Thermodesulfovibrionales bacterium]|nr:tetratricopeptide repeat protein [Thermodesulfovibrionales bacterium]
MGKFFIFYILYWLTGNPIMALLVILAVYLMVDRAYLGFLPDPFRAFKSSSRIRELKKVVSVNPHDSRSLKELGMYLLEKGDYQNATRFLEKAEEKMSDDPEFNYYYGIAAARTGEIVKGRQLFEKAVNHAPMLKYGEPYLMMAEVYMDNSEYESALPLLEKFEKIHSSSSRGLYRLGLVKLNLGLRSEGIEYLKKSIQVFKASPFFKRRTDRKWAWKSRIALLITGGR